MTTRSQERDEKVRAVLRIANEPLSPSEIARRIKEPWCCDGGFGMSAPITPICKRIGAVGDKGKWSLAKPSVLGKEKLAKVVAHLRKVADEIESGEAILSSISTWSDSLATSLTLEMANRRPKAANKVCIRDGVVTLVSEAS